MDTESTLKKPLEKKHLDFLDILKKCNGMVATACKKFNIDRKTFYKWKNNIEGFEDLVDDIDEELIDRTESKLYSLISKGSEAAVFFHLKCKAKKRGYIEKEKDDTKDDSLLKLAEAIKNVGSQNVHE